jgi:hypothetical protein
MATRIKILRQAEERRSRLLLDTRANTSGDREHLTLPRVGSKHHLFPVDGGVSVGLTDQGVEVVLEFFDSLGTTIHIGISHSLLLGKVDPRSKDIMFSCQDTFTSLQVQR